jgi:hypothetical protein
VHATFGVNSSSICWFGLPGCTSGAVNDGRCVRVSLGGSLGRTAFANGDSCNHEKLPAMIKWLMAALVHTLI